MLVFGDQVDNQVFCKQHVVEEDVNEEEDCVLGEDLLYSGKEAVGY
jgi:hypothetical protein